LPTSLTYIILSTRGSSPWRPAAVISTTTLPPQKKEFPRFFTGEEVTHQTVLKVHCSPGRNILLARQPVSKDVLSVKKKRKLFLAPLLASPSSTPLPKLKRKRLRNINRIPFWGLRTEPTKATLVRRWRNKKHKWKSRADNSQSYPPP